MEYKILIVFLNNFDDFQDFFAKIESLRVSAKSIEDLELLKR